MANAMTILLQKRQQLYQEKQALKLEYERSIRSIDSELQHIDDAIKVINQAVEPYLCKHCRGTGTISCLDAAGSRDEQTCPRCHGTGVDTTKV